MERRSTTSRPLAERGCNVTTQPTIRTTLHVGLPTCDDLAELSAIVATHCPEGATVTPAQGIWQGCTEASALVTLIHPDGPAWAVRTDALCRHLCSSLHQSAILVTTEPVRSHTYSARIHVHALADTY